MSAREGTSEHLDDLVAAGLYDPADPLAAERLELFVFLLDEVGASIPGRRFSEVTPMARSLPALIWPSYSLTPEMPTVTLPPRIAASDSPPPENAT